MTNLPMIPQSHPSLLKLAETISAAATLPPASGDGNGGGKEPKKESKRNPYNIGLFIHNPDNKYHEKAISVSTVVSNPQKILPLLKVLCLLSLKYPKVPFALYISAYGRLSICSFRPDRYNVAIVVVRGEDIIGQDVSSFITELYELINKAQKNISKYQSIKGG